MSGFSRPQLILTYVAAIPVFVLGLYAVQRPRIGTLGLLGAIGYSCAYVFYRHSAPGPGEPIVRLGRTRRRRPGVLGDYSWAADGGVRIDLRRRGRQGTGDAAVDRDDAGDRSDPGGVRISVAERRTDHLWRRARPGLRRYGPLPAHHPPFVRPSQEAVYIYPLELGRVTKHYGHNVIVDDLTFSVQPGRVMGFLGPDGTGKSSAMKILLTPEGEGTALAQVAIASFEGYDSGSGPVDQGADPKVGEPVRLHLTGWRSQVPPRMSPLALSRLGCLPSGRLVTYAPTGDGGWPRGWDRMTTGRST